MQIPLLRSYFASESQDAQRWLYYRKRQEGQNTLLLGGLDQNVLAIPTTTFGSTNDNQSSLVYNVGNSSTAYFTSNLTALYNGTYVLLLAKVV